MPFPPEILITGSERKSEPISTISILSSDPITVTVAVAPDPTGSEIIKSGGSMTSYPDPVSDTSIFSNFP